MTRRLMKGALVALLLLRGCCMQPAYAQTGFVTVSSSHLEDSSGNLVRNATISFQPQSAAGQPISYQIDGGGQATATPIRAQVNGGVFVVKPYAGNVAITLTSSAASAGCHIYLKNLTATGDSITLTPSTGNIDGGSSLTITDPGDGEVTFDGTNWKAFGGFGVRGAANLAAQYGIPYVSAAGTVTELAPNTTGTQDEVLTSSSVSGAPSAPTFKNAPALSVANMTGTLPHGDLPTLISADIPNNEANTTGTSGGLSGTPAISVSQVTATAPSAITNANCLAATTVSTPCVAYHGSFTAQGLSGTTGTITLYSSNAPAGAQFQICPNIAVTTTSSTGNIRLTGIFTTPGGLAINQLLYQISPTVSGMTSGASCFNLAVGANSSLTFVVFANVLSGSPVWETEPVVTRLY